MSVFFKILETRAREAQTTARPVRASEFETLAGAPRRCASLRDTLDAANTVLCVAALDTQDAEESARIALNAGVDALALRDTQDIPYYRRMERLWTVADFLARHRRTEPLWWRDGVFSENQLLDAAQAGARTVSIYPAATPRETRRALLKTATQAGIETVWEIFSPDEAAQAPKGALWVSARTRDETADVPAVSLFAQGRFGKHAVILPPLPPDEETARATVCGCREPL